MKVNIMIFGKFIQGQGEIDVCRFDLKTAFKHLIPFQF